MVEPQEEIEFGEQRIELRQWAAFILLVPGIGEPTLHLVGLNTLTGRGRVSSPVNGHHESQLSIRTSSGRVYALVGEPGAPHVCQAMVEQLTAGWRATVLSNVTATLFNSVRGSTGSPVTRRLLIH